MQIDKTIKNYLSKQMYSIDIITVWHIASYIIIIIIIIIYY